MKKLSLYIFLGLLLSSNTYAGMGDTYTCTTEKILSIEEVRWTTIPMAESLIDNIRNEKDISDEKLNYMNKVDEYIQQIRVFYEKAS